MIYNLRQMYDFSLLQPRKLEIFFIKGRIKLLKQGIKWLTLIFWGLSEKFINSEKEKLSISNTS